MGSSHGRVSDSRDSIGHTSHGNGNMANLRGGDDSHNTGAGYNFNWQRVDDGLSIGVDTGESPRVTSSSETLRGAAPGIDASAELLSK